MRPQVCCGPVPAERLHEPLTSSVVPLERSGAWLPVVAERLFVGEELITQASCDQPFQFPAGLPTGEQVILLLQPLSLGVDPLRAISPRGEIDGSAMNLFRPATDLMCAQREVGPGLRRAVVFTVRPAGSRIGHRGTSCLKGAGVPRAPLDRSGRGHFRPPSYNRRIDRRRVSFSRRIEIDASSYWIRR
jgi:hypothetical protein